MMVENTTKERLTTLLCALWEEFIADSDVATSTQNGQPMDQTELLRCRRDRAKLEVAIIDNVLNSLDTVSNPSFLHSSPC